MTLNDTWSVKASGTTTENFRTIGGFQKDDALSCSFSKHRQLNLQQNSNFRIRQRSSSQKYPNILEENSKGTSKGSLLEIAGLATRRVPGLRMGGTHDGAIRTRLI
uniref:Uncharacterized protein n=1 Tax=Megaselia scalaris TaxID=36166 RepID=T1GFH6_MEGSC